MNEYTLLRARLYEREASQRITSQERPAFHLTPWVGWMNDPNGFSYYKGAYHLFYQYHPYGTMWAAMHWGHAVSHDLLHWSYLPAAMAPDQPYDSHGCFSGTATELPDGRQLLIYTGVRPCEDGSEYQAQCIAIGDGQAYTKFEKNPVISEAMLPEGLSRNDFRDPRIWREQDGTYRCVIGACSEKHLGVILQYISENGLDWRCTGELARNNGQYGRMWECPDFFALDGKCILSVSPQDMLPQGLKYHNGNGTVCFIGNLDKSGIRFTPESDQPVDYGADFYAPQTILAPDGRRIMIGWMQNWDTCGHNDEPDIKWFGQMTVPREISIRDGRLIQRPIKELEQFRSNHVSYRDVAVEGAVSLQGIEGRVVDMELTVRPKDQENLYESFSVYVAQNEQFKTVISFRLHEAVLEVDRTFSGSRRNYVHKRCCGVTADVRELKLRILLDRFSVELFVNDGEQALTTVIRTEATATGITFCASGCALMDIEKYALLSQE